jgi:putative hemolysin
MANYLLGSVPQLQPLLIQVDPFGGQHSARRNVAPLRDSLRWLQQGGVLVVFPAGEVSHLQLRSRGIVDSAWDEGLARIVRRSGAAVLPIFFGGSNGPLFHLAGLLHPRLRTALLPHALLDKRQQAIDMRIGSSIPAERLLHRSDRELIDYLRFRTYLLGRRAKSAGSRPPGKKAPEPILPPQDPAILRAEIVRLPADRLLAESGHLAVLQAEAREIPWLLLEVGRLREITFRGVGEGTGRALDLDRFDEHYTHLVLWNRQTAEVVGAYRMGRTDVILERFGADGLYTSTLFDYQPELPAKLGPALEMGRSFVRPEYQKSYTPLLLLWKGIGAFVARHPHYRTLFGPVSISNEYTPLSRQLMADALSRSCTIPELAHLVRGKNPLRLKPMRLKGCRRPASGTLANDLEEMAELVADLEPDGKGLPVLLRHYLGLGGKILAFNVDAQFSDVLDGLVLVDLLHTEPKTLARYLGKDGAEKFQTWHQEHPEEAALCA